MTVRYAPPGTTLHTRPGDSILTHGSGLIPETIRFGQWLRFRHAQVEAVDGTTDEDAIYYSHAAGVVGKGGELVEMLAGGATRSSLAKYHDTPYHVIRPDSLSPMGAVRAVEYWEHCADVQVDYGFVIIGSEALTCATGSTFRFGVKGTLICSGMVAAGYVRAGVPETFDWTPDPSHVFPVELGLRFGVRR